jgi:hypothetical protein
MHRRWIPLATALLMFALALTPVWSDVLSDLDANRLTLSLLAAVCALLAVVFWTIRRRMAVEVRAQQRTRFGQSLIDCIGAVALFCVVLAVFFGAFAWAQWRLRALAAWEITGLRAALASTGTLAIGTGVAMLWEMSRALPDLAVHEPVLPPDVVFDRRRGPQPPLKGD